MGTSTTSSELSDKLLTPLVASGNKLTQTPSTNTELLDSMDSTKDSNSDRKLSTDSPHSSSNNNFKTSGESTSTFQVWEALDSERTVWESTPHSVEWVPTGTNN